MQRRRFFYTKVTPKATKNTQQRRRLDDLGVSLLAAGHSHPGKRGELFPSKQEKTYVPKHSSLTPYVSRSGAPAAVMSASKTNKLLQRDSTCSTGTEARPGDACLARNQSQTRWQGSAFQG